ncbi:MAG: NUDIX domain-containing protein [Planctomycetota bacterium]|nr:NUDIX domain-containing protein [Planctomycetota bacterium]
MPDKHGVVALLPAPDGRHLFIRRGWSLPRAPGVWCFVGGEVEAGETYAEAVVREVREEVGLAVRAGEPFHESLSPNGEFRLHWLRVELLDAEAAVTPHPQEVAEFRWLTFAEALALEPMLPTLRAWLEEAARGQAGGGPGGK